MFHEKGVAVPEYLGSLFLGDKKTEGNLSAGVGGTLWFADVKGIVEHMGQGYKMTEAVRK